MVNTVLNSMGGFSMAKCERHNQMVNLKHGYKPILTSLLVLLCYLNVMGCLRSPAFRICHFCRVSKIGNVWYSYTGIASENHQISPILIGKSSINSINSGSSNAMWGLLECNPSEGLLCHAILRESIFGGFAATCSKTITGFCRVHRPQQNP